MRLVAQGQGLGPSLPAPKFPASVAKDSMAQAGGYSGVAELRAAARAGTLAPGAP